MDGCVCEQMSLWVKGCLSVYIMDVDVGEWISVCQQMSVWMNGCLSVCMDVCW